MTVVHYNKAIRDRIPEIIQAAGKTCVVEEVDADVFLAKLIEKLGEESAEFKENPSAEELADTLEVLMAIAKYHGISWAEVERVRAAKAGERGAFERRLVLMAVDGSVAP